MTEHNATPVEQCEPQEAEIQIEVAADARSEQDYNDSLLRQLEELGYIDAGLDI